MKELTAFQGVCSVWGFVVEYLNRYSVLRIFCVTLSWVLRCIDSRKNRRKWIPRTATLSQGVACTPHRMLLRQLSARTARRCTRARNRFGIRMSNRGPNHIWQFQEFASACLHLLMDCKIGFAAASTLLFRPGGTHVCFSRESC